jgi:hypothetical protein
MLLAAVVLKLVPVKVTVVPIGPEVGVKPVMVGTWAWREIPIRHADRKMHSFWIIVFMVI